MGSSTSDDDIDAGWEEPEEPPSTQAVDSIELMQRAGMTRRDSASLPVDQRATVPPPVPTSEYVAQMMRQVPESDSQPSMPALSDRHRPVMLTLHEEDPLRFDFDDAQVHAAPTEHSALAGPSIETSMVALSDVPPDLLRDSPLPAIDELDALPVDDVLSTVALKTQNPPLRPIGSGGLDPVSISDIPISEGPVSDSTPTGDDPYLRATMPGFDASDPIGKVHDRFIAGDYSGALVLAEALLEEQPEHLEAQRYAESCRDMLRQMYLSRLGSGDRVPHVVMAQDQLRWLTLDHRAGFLLSCIDGTSTVDDILDVCGMPPLDALRILYELLTEGVIQMEPPSSSTVRQG